MTRTSLARLFAIGLAAAALAGCSAAGGGALSAGLTQRMDQPGANLNRAEALGIVNQYRAASGAGQLTADAGLDATAQQLAADYARGGTAPKRPEGIVALRSSAGYANFAETFSGWRNAPDDAAALAERTATRAGVGVAYDPDSTYGVYWILLLDD